MALVSLNDYEEAAKKRLGKAALGYYASGATEQHTLAENKTSFLRWHIRPRFMRDVSVRDMSTEVLGIKVSLPFGVAPTAMQRMAHPEGECATARAAASIGSVFTLSTISTTSIEGIAEATPKSIKFFQLYIYKDRGITASLVKRAEKAGFKALVLTVDAPYFGIRYADVRNKFTLPPHLRMANFNNKDTKSAVPGATKNIISGINQYVASLFDPSLTWKDVAWLKSLTHLPIVLKGILTREDVELGLKAGAAAIWVSNHGARQLDGVTPTMDALAEVVDAVKGRCEIYVDGGFRTGPDVFKALALGANMVFLGRPLIWGLACDGEIGAYNILDIMKRELDSAMGITGCTKMSDIKREMITRAYLWSKI